MRKGERPVDLIKRTIDLAKGNVEEGGRPFACIIVRNNEILGEGVNQVAQTNDPTAHAEIIAIRKAATTLQTEHFLDCHIYTMAHACPMCLAAMYYCSPERVVFITTREDYAPFYTDDRKYFTFSTFYEELGKPWTERKLPMRHQPHPDAVGVFQRWKELNAS